MFFNFLFSRCGKHDDKAAFVFGEVCVDRLFCSEWFGCVFFFVCTVFELGFLKGGVPSKPESQKLGFVEKQKKENG